MTALVEGQPLDFEDPRAEWIFKDWLYSLDAPGAFDVAAMPELWRRGHRWLSIEYRRFQTWQAHHQTDLLSRLVKKPTL